MSEAMNLSVNGQSQVPPGFRFHPTEEELLHYYLRKKVASEKIDLDVIGDVDLNKLEPWDLQEKCRIGSTPQNDWYFFSHKDKKYPTGTRTNRATTAGFWKATGRDKVIYSSLERIGMRKTLVFYMGRAPHGHKSDWIMHEYRLEEHNSHNIISFDSMSEDGWVVCRVFRKKNYQRSLESPKLLSTSTISRTQMLDNNENDEVLDQILQYMGRNCKQENENVNFITNNSIMHLPRLPETRNGQLFDELSIGEYETRVIENETHVHEKAGTNDWASLDRLVASQLNGNNVITETSKQLSCFISDPNIVLSPFDGFEADHDIVQLSHNNTPIIQGSQTYNSSEIDLWSFPRSSSSSSSDPLNHFSV